MKYLILFISVFDRHLIYNSDSVLYTTLKDNWLKQKLLLQQPLVHILINIIQIKINIQPCGLTVWNIYSVAAFYTHDEQMFVTMC